MGRLARLVALSLSLSACVPLPFFPTGWINLGQVSASAPEGGVVRVEAGPGTVRDPAVTTVTLTVMREGAAARTVLHLNGNLPIASTYATVNPDGGFGPVTLGTADRPVATADELNLTPQTGIAQAGPTVATFVP